MKHLALSLAILASLSCHAADDRLKLEKGEPVTLSPDAVELANVIAPCSKEFATASQRGRVGSAVHWVFEDLDIYQVNFVDGGYAPLFQASDVAILVVTKSREAGGFVPDKPTQYNYNCQVVYP